MNSPESTRLFHPYEGLEGIIRCSICGELFVRVDHLKALRKSLKKAGRSIHGLENTETERIRRRKHAQEHVVRGEARLERDGRFVLLPKPAPTARDFGFSIESA